MATQRAQAATQAKRRGGEDRVIASNRRATHEYFIDEAIETGLVLTGSEIKSIRAGKVTIAEAYVRVEHGELWLIGANIAPFAQGGYANHEADRPRKLLAHRRQIAALAAEIERKGMTLVPLRLKLKDGRAKLDVGVARGKKLYDKRGAEADREAARDIQRALRDRS